MRRLLKLLAWWPTQRMLQLACLLGLVALVMMMWGVLSGAPLPVVASMSVAQGLGVGACLLFGLSVAADVAQRKPEGP